MGELLSEADLGKNSDQDKYASCVCEPFQSSQEDKLNQTFQIIETLHVQQRLWPFPGQGAACPWESPLCFPFHISLLKKVDETQKSFSKGSVWPLTSRQKRDSRKGRRQQIWADAQEPWAGVTQTLVRPWWLWWDWAGTTTNHVLGASLLLPGLSHTSFPILTTTLQAKPEEPCFTDKGPGL